MSTQCTGGQSGWRCGGVKVAFMALWLAPVVALRAQEAPPPRTPLAGKQSIIRDRVQRLEDQMYRLLERLQAEQPEQAERLQSTLERMGELNVRQDLKGIIALLDADELETAVEAQGALIDDLSALLTLLISDEDDDEVLQQELQRLRDVLARLDGLLAEQNRVAEASRSAAHQLDGSPADAEAAADIAQLQQQQRAVYDDTQKRYDKTPDAESPEALRAAQERLVPEADRLARLLKDKQEDVSHERLAEAGRDMKDAVDQLARDAMGAASDAQEDALRNLERALEKLTKRPPEGSEQPDIEGLAEAQRQTGQRTAALSGELRQQDQPTPGQDNVALAQERMDQAAAQLEDGRPAEALEPQQQAEQQLQEARAQVQQAIDELQRERQRRKLEELEQQFRHMLDRQHSINSATLELHRVEAPHWQRVHRLQAVELKQRERALGEEAGRCLEVLAEDGTTAVLPRLVAHLRDDMFTVATRLGDAQVGDVTQHLQGDIVAALEDILSALEQERRRAPEESRSGQEGQQGDPPLLPTSAELRLLANQQERILNRTRAYHRLNAEDAEELLRIAEKQKDVAVMAEEMNRRLQGPPAAEPEHQP